MAGFRMDHDPEAVAGADPARRSRRSVSIAVDSVRLPGELVVPDRPAAVVLFAHGSGSSRHSPRNVAVAERLNDAALATLLFDLLVPEEAVDRERVFDIDLLASRLEAATGWVREQDDVGAVPPVFFGASTGAAAALVAAARLRDRVGAVVSRGGRPDLAGDALELVAAPTLLIVGGEDRVVLDLNRGAQERLRCETRLEVVPGAGHLFEEPGTLERVAELATSWIIQHIEDRPRGATSG
jgi:putative phosphoribosyl transferase